MGKVNQVRTLLQEDAHLTPAQMEFLRGEFQELKVELIAGDNIAVLINRTGPGFFKNTTPVEIAELVKSRL